MSNTHKKEILRLAEAPDRTKVWVNTMFCSQSWTLLSAAKWSPDYKYVVDDGFYVEERKAFHGGEEIQYKLIDRDDWTKVEEDHEWSKHFQYRIKPIRWYRDASNVGKLVNVNNENHEDFGHIRRFAGFNGVAFKVEGGEAWKYAWLIKPDELAKDVK